MVAGVNIKDALASMVELNLPGEGGLVFHFSGHGVQIPDEAGNKDVYDNALCASDMNLIMDDDFREVLKRLDPTVKFTVLLDCCHADGLLDHQCLQLGLEVRSQWFFFSRNIG